MLRDEITPFAQGHRNVIDEIIENLTPPTVFAESITLTREDAAEIVRKLQTTKRGLDRFEACALDEWRMKENYRNVAQNCRLNHRDK